MRKPTDMSEANGPNWSLAKVLYCQHVARGEIVKLIGCSRSALDKRIQRGAWTELRTQASQIVSKPAKKGQIAVRRTPESNRDALAADSDDVRRGLGADLQRTVALLPELPHSTNPKRFKERAEAVRVVAETSKTVFQWDDNVNRDPNNWDLYMAVTAKGFDKTTITEQNIATGEIRQIHMVEDVDTYECELGWRVIQRGQRKIIDVTPVPESTPGIGPCPDSAGTRLDDAARRLLDGTEPQSNRNPSNGQ